MQFGLALLGFHPLLDRLPCPHRFALGMLSARFRALAPGLLTTYIVRYGDQVSPFLRYSPDQALTITVENSIHTIWRAVKGNLDHIHPWQFGEPLHTRA